MNRLMQGKVLAALLAAWCAVSAQPVWAKYGVRSCYNKLDGCCDCRLDTFSDGCSCGQSTCNTQCHTVMKSVPKVHYRNVTETRYRTVYRTEWNVRTVPISFRIPHVSYESVPYTFQRAVYHTVTRPVHYTVNVPVHEPRTRNVSYTVYHTTYEPHTRTVPYTVYNPVCENRTRQVPYTVYLPQFETVTRPYSYTVYRNVVETRQRVIPYTVRKPVHYTKTITINTGHWETQTIEQPGPVITKCAQEPGCWEWDPSRCCCTYKPGPVRHVQVQCPPVRTCKRIWVPRVEHKHVNCVRWTYETRTRTEPYTVCRSQPETRTKMHTYTVCRHVPQQRVKTVQYTVTRMVPEQRTRTVHYTVRRVHAETRVKTIHYTAVRMVPEQRTRMVSRQVRQLIPETCYRQVARTNWQVVNSTKTVRTPRSIPQQIPYTVTRCIRQVTYQQVAVRVCTTLPSCCGGQLSAGHVDHGHHDHSYLDHGAAPAYDGAPMGEQYHGGQSEGPALGGPAIEEGAIAPSEGGLPPRDSTAPPAAVDDAPDAGAGDKSVLPPGDLPAGDLPAGDDAGETAENVNGLKGLAITDQEYFTNRENRKGNARTNSDRVRALYIQALSMYDNGDQYTAAEVVRQAVKLEKDSPLKNYGQMMERVQGQRRVWLENIRNRYQRQQ